MNQKNKKEMKKNSIVKDINFLPKISAFPNKSTTKRSNRNVVDYIAIKKRKRDSNGMESARLIPDSIISYKKYLNVSINFYKDHVGMAEWSTQSVDTRYPLGCVGSIPTPDVIHIFNKMILQRGGK